MARLKIISGGQTGVERAALDAALDLGFTAGGWCPRDRWAEDGEIPKHYPLSETRSEDVHVRTIRNVECSSATLLLTRGPLMGGCRLTSDSARSVCRPLLIVDLAQQGEDPVDTVLAFLKTYSPRVLNISGPKESSAPGIHEQALCLLKIVFELANAQWTEAPSFLSAPAPENTLRAN